jgi:hypothetical protein
VSAHADPVTSIRNAGYFVRHYWRGARGSTQRAERAAAILQLGLAARAALNSTEDFEPVLTAIVDALVPRDPRF